MLHRQSLDNFKFQLTVRVAKSSFHLGRRFSVREKKPKVRRAFGPSRDQIMQARRDLDIFNSGRGAGLHFPFYFF